MFLAYNSADYNKMVELVKDMSASEFTAEVKMEEINLLHHCVMQENLDAMKSLATLPFFREAINDNGNEQGWTPLLSACASQVKVANIEMVKLLVDNGANLRQSLTNKNIGVVHFAASNGDTMLLDYLLERVPEAVAYKTNGDARTPAHYAALFNRFDALNLLIERGANLLTFSGEHYNVFDEAVR